MAIIKMTGLIRMFAVPRIKAAVAAMTPTGQSAVAPKWMPGSIQVVTMRASALIIQTIKNERPL